MPSCWLLALTASALADASVDPEFDDDEGAAFPHDSAMAHAADDSIEPIEGSARLVRAEAIATAEHLGTVTLRATLEEACGEGTAPLINEFLRCAVHVFYDPLQGWQVDPRGPPLDERCVLEMPP